MLTPVRRALLSVSDKTGIVEFARELKERGIELLSTGGTAKLLVRHGISVKEVAEHTGFPEIMGGRVKTLHPKIHGGLLGRRGIDESVMREHGIEPIDLLAVNLYPFAATVARPDCSYEDAVENIDIGGPAMVRAAAKNHASVTVVVDPADYRGLLDELAANQGATDIVMRQKLAAKAFAHTAEYDAMVSAYFTGAIGNASPTFPDDLNLSFRKRSELRYGENPHQRAALYRDDPPLDGASIAQLPPAAGQGAVVQQYCRRGCGLECVQTFAEPACVIVKHANPCGVAIAPDTLAAYRTAFALTRPRRSAASSPSIVRSMRQPWQAVSAQFVEVLIAPGYAPDAVAALGARPTSACCEIGARHAGDGNAWDMKERRRRHVGADEGRRTMCGPRMRVVTQGPPSQRSNGRPAVRVARRQICQVQRHRRAAGTHARHRRRTNEPGR